MFNRPMAEAAGANIALVGLPTWTADEQAFAKAVQRLAGGAETGLSTTLRGVTPPQPAPTNGGSDDIGDVSWAVPTISINYPSNIPNLPGHNWVNAIAMATPVAHKGVIAGAKVVAMTSLDMLLDRSLLDRAKADFAEQGRRQKYEPLLRPEDRPKIEMNGDVMARYRPELRKFYYDASRYPTYLDQLGIKFPELAPTAAR